MPTSVTSSSGISFHLWQLPDLSAPEPVDAIEFTTLENELSQGYREAVLFGSDTGVREWKLSLPTLAGSTVPMPTVTDPFGATVSREQYVRNLYKYNRTTGKAFAYQWPATTGQYYLVDFANDSLAYQRKKNINIYSTEIVLRQRRLNGITIHDVGSNFYNDGLNIAYWLYGSRYVSPTWSPGVPQAGGTVGNSLTGSGDVAKVAGAQNGQDIVRFNNASNTGTTYGELTGGVYDIFLVLKMRETTFSNNAGILTGASPADPRILVGVAGTTKFLNPAMSATEFTYTLNGVAYAQSNLQAPMNEYGVIHIKYRPGYLFDFGAFLQLGQDRTTAGTFAQMDVGELIIHLDAPCPQYIARETIEYLGIKWGIDI